MKRYNPKDIEPRWQQRWAEAKLYAAKDFDETRQKYVMLTEFPYPSGDGLHLGHTREYTLGDISARFKRMQGYNVLYPMGYDAFGLPTENYAIKNKIAPQVATDRNVANFQKQFESLGFSFDWDRSFRTTDPAYYKWTQWLFLQFFKAGLAYQDDIAINWCPHCKTGLANEEVTNGRHERCDTIVEKKQLKQWLLKITAYADRLIDGLQDVDYPSRIADQQINWIARSKGAEVDFEVKDHDETLTVFTTRPDTLFGATFMVLAPEHPLVEKITTDKQRGAVNSYRAAAAAKSEIERQDDSREKTGVFTGAYAVNPVNEAQVPIWIADYVLAGYGTGAIMAVPGHDERDFAFAKKYNLPILQVVAPETGTVRENETFADGGAGIVFDPTTQKYAFNQLPNGNVVLFAGGLNDGEDLHQAILREVREESGLTDIADYEEVAVAYGHYHNSLKNLNRVAKATCLLVTLNSRMQGEVAHEAHEEGIRVIWRDAKDILQLWEADASGDYEHYAYFLRQAVSRAIEKGIDTTSSKDAFTTAAVTGEGILVHSGAYDGLKTNEARDQIVADLAVAGKAKEKIQYRLRDWIFSRQHYWGEPIPIIHCEEHGAVAVPEADLPVVLPPVEQYEPSDTGESPLAAIVEWVNTVCPTCGKPAKRETDTMPNWAGSSWYYLRYFDAHNESVFADRKKLEYWGAVDMYLGGMEHTTLHLLYSRFWHQFFFDQGLVPTPEPYLARRGQGIILAADGSKMSKSKGNVINPTEIIEQGYGADALRLAIAFLAPYDQTTPWSPEGVAGTHRFISRIWALVQSYDPQAIDAADTLPMAAVHTAIKKVTEDLRDMDYNTAIAAQMTLINELYKQRPERLGSRWKPILETVIKLLAPFAPHVADEMWEQIGNQASVHIADWPAYDESLLKTDEITLVVQVNGKLRGSVIVPADIAESDAIEAAKTCESVSPHLADTTIVKEIFVPGKLVNFVTKSQ